MAVSPAAAAVKRKSEIKEYLEERALELLSHFNSRNIEAIIRVTRSTLDTMRKRVNVATAVHYVESSVGMKDEGQHNSPFFRADVVLTIPNITMQPALDEIQQGINKAAYMVVGVSKGIRQWEKTCRALAKPEKEKESTKRKENELDIPARSRAGSVLSQTSETAGSEAGASRGKIWGRDRGDSVATGSLSTAIKGTYYKNVAENKEVAKLVSVLQTIINSQKKEVTTALEQFDRYHNIWSEDKQEKMERFIDDNPNLGEFEHQILQLKELERVVMLEPESYNVGAIALFTGQY